MATATPARPTLDRTLARLDYEQARDRALAAYAEWNLRDGKFLYHERRAAFFLAQDAESEALEKLRRACEA